MAELINGKELAEKCRQRLLKNPKLKDNGIHRISRFIGRGNPASQIYVRNKERSKRNRNPFIGRALS